jgi:hypothetical protein
MLNWLKITSKTKTIDKERLPLLSIQLAKFRTPLLAKTPACKTGF